MEENRDRGLRRKKKREYEKENKENGIKQEMTGRKRVVSKKT